MKRRMLSVALVVAVFLSLAGQAGAVSLIMICEYTELRTDLDTGKTVDYGSDSFRFVFDAKANTLNGFKPGKAGFGLVNEKEATLTITDAEISSFLPSVHGDWTQTINRLDGNYKAIKTGRGWKSEFQGHCAPIKLPF
ncbi:MAG TPA: hypothetical protein VIU41_15035 [Geobacteraceae bacterium]